MNHHVIRYLFAFIAGCAVSATGILFSYRQSDSEWPTPEKIYFCNIDKDTLERWVSSGWDINTSVELKSGGRLGLISTRILDLAKCTFDDDLAAFYIENDGAFDFQALLTLSKRAKDEGGEKTLALIEKLKSSL